MALSKQAIAGEMHKNSTYARVELEATSGIAKGLRQKCVRLSPWEGPWRTCIQLPFFAILYARASPQNTFPCDSVVRAYATSRFHESKSPSCEYPALGNVCLPSHTHPCWFARVRLCHLRCSLPPASMLARKEWASKITKAVHQPWCIWYQAALCESQEAYQKKHQ